MNKLTSTRTGRYGYEHWIIGPTQQHYQSHTTEHSDAPDVHSEGKYSRPCACHEGMWGYGGIDPLIIKRGTRWRWMIHFTPRSPYRRGKSLLYRQDKTLGEPQSRSEFCRQENKSLATVGNPAQIPRSASPWPGLYSHFIVPMATLYNTSWDYIQISECSDEVN